jgi:hypothetical protein
LSDSPADIVIALRDYASNPGYSHNDYADTMRQAAHCIESMRAMFFNYATLASPAVPEGYKIVPIEPTPEMLEAVYSSSKWDNMDPPARVSWGKMVEAAPAVSQKAAPEAPALRPLSAGLPLPEDHDRVLVYTEGVDFAGDQYFDINTEDLWEPDPDMRTEVADAATHWMPLPRPGAAPAPVTQQAVSQMDGAAYSAPFTTDVPQCCEDPKNCAEPCTPAATTASASSLDQQINAVMSVPDAQLDEHLRSIGLDPAECEAAGRKAVAGALNTIGAQAPSREREVKGWMARYEELDGLGGPDEMMRCMEAEIADLRAALPQQGASHAPTAVQSICSDARFMAALDSYMDAVTYDERNSDKRIACRKAIFGAADAWASALANSGASHAANAGEDAGRLDFMAEHEAWIAWTKDGESCRVFVRNEDGDTGPLMGWIPEAWAHSAREAIDKARAAIASSAAQEGK